MLSLSSNLSALRLVKTWAEARSAIRAIERSLGVALPASPVEQPGTAWNIPHGRPAEAAAPNLPIRDETPRRLSSCFVARPAASAAAAAATSSAAPRAGPEVRKPVISVDCEGAALGRFGPASIVTLGVPRLAGVGGGVARDFGGFAVTRDSTDVFVFDALQDGVVGELAPLLSSSAILRVAHDLREDNSALTWQHGAPLGGPLWDTQIAHALLELGAGVQREQVGWMVGLERLVDGLSAGEHEQKERKYEAAAGGSPPAACEAEMSSSSAVARERRAAVKALMVHDSGALWLARPLRTDAVRYAIGDALPTLRIAQAQMAQLSQQCRAKSIARLHNAAGPSFSDCAEEGLVGTNTTTTTTAATTAERIAAATAALFAAKLDDSDAVSGQYLRYAALNSHILAPYEASFKHQRLHGLLSAKTDDGLFFALNCGRVGVATANQSRRRLADAEIGDIVGLAVAGSSPDGKFVFVDLLDESKSWHDCARRPTWDGDGVFRFQSHNPSGVFPADAGCDPWVDGRADGGADPWVTGMSS